jgi:hypothetical protein
MRITGFFTLLASTLIAFGGMAQNRYHVNQTTGNDANDGLKWSRAFATLQTALDRAVALDTVLVAQGTYKPTRKYAESFRDGTPTTARDVGFLLHDSVALIGGFPGTVTDAVTSVANPDWREYRTLLSGDLSDNDLPDGSGWNDNARHVIIVFDADNQTLIDGFYITGGYSDAPQKADCVIDGKSYELDPVFGGGIHCYSKYLEASPRLRNLSVYFNTAMSEGGGIYIYGFNGDASPEISDVDIWANTANSRTSSYNTRGGGLFVASNGYVNAKITNAKIAGNSATFSMTGATVSGFSYGGGAYFRALKDCKPVIQNSLVTGNLANCGGGLYFYSKEMTTAPVLTNVTVSGNMASAINNENGTDDGGGVTVFAETLTAEIILENTVICDNKGDRKHELLVFGNGGSSFLSANSFVKGETLGGGSNLSGATSTASMFSSPLAADEAPTHNGMDGSYQLHSASPLTDKGHSKLLSLTKDIDGNARIYGSSIDIGAYEYQGVERPANDLVSEAGAVWTYRTTLYVKAGAKTSLSIYSINGTLVRHDAVNEGEYQYELPRGCYIVKLGDTTRKTVIN